MSRVSGVRIPQLSNRIIYEFDGNRQSAEETVLSVSNFMICTVQDTIFIVRRERTNEYNAVLLVHVFVCRSA